MAYILGTGTASPPYALSAAEVKRVGHDLFAPVFEGRRRSFAEMVDATCIAERQLVRPLEEILRPRPLEVTSAWYAEATRALASEALGGALASAGVGPREIDALVVCTATGFMMPSLDCDLVNDLGLSPWTRRYPYTSLGCSGGAGGVVRAADVSAALGADATVALVVVETPSLAFRPGDLSMQNAVSTTLFGDGAAAVILRGRPPAGRRALRVRSGRTWLLPESRQAMGLNLRSDGFEVVLSAAVPALAGQAIPELAGVLAADAAATPSDLRFFVIHPGGRRVLEEIERALGLGPRTAATAWDVLRDHGNMSAATVLFVLHEQRRRGLPPPGTLGMLVAFGPGLSAELALLEVTGP